MLIQGNNRMVVNNALVRTDDGFYRMDLDGLERIFEQERPPMMVLCNPHNPIGIAWDADVQVQPAQPHRHRLGRRRSTPSGNAGT